MNELANLNNISNRSRCVYCLKKILAPVGIEECGGYVRFGKSALIMCAACRSTFCMDFAMMNGRPIIRKEVKRENISRHDLIAKIQNGTLSEEEEARLLRRT